MKTPLSQRTFVEYFCFIHMYMALATLRLFNSLQNDPIWKFLFPTYIYTELPTMKHWRIGEESLHDSTQSPHGIGL